MNQAIMPDPELYEQTKDYMPWQLMHARTVELAIQEVPRHGHIVDLMCGTGLLLRNIHKKRPDLQLTGVDIDGRYVNFAQQKLNNANFICADVREWNSNQTFNVVICHGAMHHLPYEDQPAFGETVRDLLAANGLAIIADACIGDFKTESERRLAAAELGYVYLKESILAADSVPAEICGVAIEIMANDVMGIEYKCSFKQRDELLAGLFQNHQVIKTWPDYDSNYGEFIWILRP